MVGTKYQRADIFTKALSGPLWQPALNMLGIHEEYNIIKTSQAGLKISQDMTLAPPQTGAGPAEHKIGYKKKQRGSRYGKPLTLNQPKVDFLYGTLICDDDMRAQPRRE